MNKILTSLMLISSLTFGQTTQVEGTTEAEYNYVTRGYRVDLESGVEIQDGYRLDDVTEPLKVDEYTFHVRSLVRTKRKEMAALMVIAKSNVSGKTHYVCIPRGNEALTLRYFASIRDWGRGISQAYAKVLSVVLIHYQSALKVE